ncbi:FAD-dependent oxidoreductase [Roseovarius sp. EL26]|uniref:GcvT family protein n=1 Tax=Roseovarius sp. EL26 TaxID=2126672 RepID=UPI000EA06B48|nr:FAD-dependent oxidoreductase [Roseovarius sp. EL26]
MGRTVIIGGGAIGLSLAYHLARRGAEDVVLLERNQLTSGTSWHAAGIVGPLRATPNMTKLAMYAVELFPQLEAETGMSTGYKRTGGYWLARRPERMDELKRIASLGRHFGLTPEIVTPEVAAKAVPGLNVASHAGAMAVAEDANVNPVDLCMVYARAAKNTGVEIRENVAVSGVVTTAGQVTGVMLEDGSVIEADQVAICAGAWSKPLAATAGLALPLQAVEHMYVVTEPMLGLPDPFPVLRDMDTGIYIKGDAGKLVIGGFEPNAKCWDAFGPEGNRPFLEMPEDWDQFMPFMEAALELMPALADVGIQHFMNGPESFTNDTRPLVGEAPSVDGLFVAAGMNSVGIMSSAGIGRALADWMVDQTPAMDLWEVDIARADPKTATQDHMDARMQEAVSDLMAMHWPFKQPKAGRGLRQSALHDHWSAQGAVFGLAGGWERGLYYANDASERDLPYSIADQPWWPLAEREAATMQTGTALLDLTPFGKFDIEGPEALSFLELLCTARIDRPHGRAIYTLALNDAGGIELDAAVTRLGEHTFRVTSGAATRWRDAGLLRRRAQGFDVTITDVTEAEAVIGVMGAGSRDMLSDLSPDDWTQFPFSTCQEITIVGIQCRATRMSFVGELGWELSLPAEEAGAVFNALTKAGAKPLGHYALDGCRLEKGFKHWGHDLGPEITPLEAGLGFAINWDKTFIGKSSLVQQHESGVSQRLCLFKVSGGPLMLHDELIVEAGQVVGLTTSGGRGPRTGETLAFGLIRVVPDETQADTCAREFEIEVAGKRYPAQALLQPPFDPKSERMRG